MLKNIAFVFSSSIVSQILNFISGILVIKMVSVKDFGSYSVAVSFINLFVVILGGFLTGALRRFTAYYRGNNSFEYISGILKLSLIYAFIIGLILFLVFFLFSKALSINVLKSNDYAKFLFFYSLSIPFSIFATYLSSYLTGFEKFKLVSLSNNVISNIVRLFTLIVWWLFLPFKEIGIVLSLVFKSIVNFFHLLLYSKNELKFIKYKSSFEFKEWFKFSLPGFFRYGLSYLSDNIGVIILGSIKDSINAGIYRGANFITSILWNLNLAFSSVLIPKISFLISQKKEIIAIRILRKYAILNAVLVYISLLFFIFFGEWVLLLLGKDYVLGYGVLILLSFQVLIGTFSSPFEIYLEAKGRTDLNLVSYAIYSISTLAFLFIFTNMYAKEGTAISYLLSIIVLFISRIVIFRIFVRGDIYKPLDYIVFLIVLVFTFVFAILKL
ncbi:MAG: oligosaccharide flippase family protein [candidate division WOR-3 bacterium]|nr:oligosaccharide flippase family protein [candidate division WOR-3 bacterium]MCX7947406.1 oligosaccharide flippase family protein [candidate division WOR-3 bacterium]MDW8151196.1 oligosaccharide flippase family protein [candidate division WOR-3 bacterium]